MKQNIILAFIIFSILTTTFQTKSFAQTKPYLESVTGYEFNNYTQGKRTKIFTFEYHDNQTVSDYRSTFFTKYDGKNDGIYYSKSHQEYNRKSKRIKWLSKNREKSNDSVYSDSHHISNFEDIRYLNNDTIPQSVFYGYNYNSELALTNYNKSYYHYGETKIDSIKEYFYTLIDSENLKYDSTINRTQIVHNYTDSTVTFSYGHYGTEANYLSSKKINRFNNLNQNISQTTYFYRRNEIFAFQEISWAYDEFGRDTLEHKISIENQKLTSSYTNRTSYNNLGQVTFTERIIKTNNHYNSAMDEIRNISEYDYDLSGNLLQQRSFYKHHDSEQFQNAQVDYSYNQDSILTEFTIYTTFPSHTELKPCLRYVIKSNDLIYEEIVPNGFYLSSLIPYGSNIKIDKAIKEVIKYEYFNNEWQPKEIIKATYNQREFIENETIENDIEVWVYPNPCSDYIYIEIDNDKPHTFQLFNANAQPILERKMIRNLKLNTSHFKNGLYFYCIKSNEDIIRTDKFIISK